MSSPPPIDPYIALGVSKDADLATIRSAHRKLILKFHPDRIKDESARLSGREEFQKAQQAYELLSDSTKRARYDDRVKLVELRKEALGRDYTRPAAQYSRPSYETTRDYSGGAFFEERAPKNTSFYEEESRYREEPPRSSARKGDGYERKVSGGQSEKKATAWMAGDLPVHFAQNLKKKAAGVKERVKEKDARAASAKARDQDRKRNASEKHSSRRAHVEDDYSSDSDTVTYASVNRKPTKAAADPAPRRSRAEPRKKSSRYSDEDDHPPFDKHHNLQATARDYIQRASPDYALPNRQNSAQSYFEPKEERGHRRTASDRDDRRHNREERPRSTKSRRPSYSEVEPQIEIRAPKIPSMPNATSAPANLRNLEDRSRDAPPRPYRSTTTQASSRDSRKEPPPLPRSMTMPSSASQPRRGEKTAARGSNLKHAETHDSGYGSSGPATPDMSGTSPPKQNKVRYQIVEEAEEYARGHRAILIEPEDQHRRSRSPAEHVRPVLSTSGNRSKASRSATTAFTSRSTAEQIPFRPSPSRHESARSSAPPRETVHTSRSSARDRKPQYRDPSSDDDEGAYTHRNSSEKISTPRHKPSENLFGEYPRRGSYDLPQGNDVYPGSHYHPGMGHRKTSVAH